MAAVTSAVIGGVSAAVSIAGQIRQRERQKEAAAGQQQAQIQSAQQLAEAGALASEDIRAASEQAKERFGLGSQEAISRIRPFEAPGVQAFEQFRDLTLSGRDISGPIAESIRLGSAVESPVFATSPVVDREMQRQADINVSGLTPGFARSLGSAAQQGIATVGDIAGIRQRELETLADIASATGAQRGTALVGQVPGLLQLSGGAEEARLLGEVAGQQGRADVIESLAEFAGGLR
jgi:hypothetical protein